MSRMDFDPDCVNPEEDKGLNENEEGINQPQSGENKCNQCDYASSRTRNLRTHLKTHSEEKSNKCNQCNFIAGIPFEDTFENTQWRKVKQMQPM